MTTRMNETEDISFNDALARTVRNIFPLPYDTVNIAHLTGRVAAVDVVSLIDAPSADVSLKDGYAVRAADIEKASEEYPVVLALDGTVFAGSADTYAVKTGRAVKVMSGAVLPEGTDAVISREFASDDGFQVQIMNNARTGQNILKRGTDIRRGDLIIAKGTMLRPPHIGFIAAAGHSSVKVYAFPHVALIATGDEVLAIGEPFAEGKVFASNLVTCAAWCAHYGMKTDATIVGDNEEEISRVMLRSIDTANCLITSGGAWKSERDLTVRILDTLGWKKIYHRVRMGPGKAVGFGFLNAKPVFCLPGGPPSNQMAFLQLALPGLLSLSGHRDIGLPSVMAVMGETVRGQRDWTQFIYGTLEGGDNTLFFYPLNKTGSRLRMMARAQGIACIPEGEEYIGKGTVISVQMLQAQGVQRS